MSTSTPSKPAATPGALSLTPSQQQKIISNVALGALIVCPIVILLPPRKFDAYTIALIAGTLAGANQVSYDYRGVSIVQRWSARMQGWSTMMEQDLPPKAKEMQERIRRERSERDARLGAKLKGSVLGEKEDIGILEKVWMGNEGADWKEKRDQREKEALEQGRGYGSLIMDQLKDVWGWGEKKATEVKEKDEEVIKQRKEEEARKKD